MMVIMWAFFALCVAIGVAAAVLTRLFGLHVLWLWLAILCLGGVHALDYFERYPVPMTLMLIIAVAVPMLAGLGLGTMAGLVARQGDWTGDDDLHAPNAGDDGGQPVRHHPRG